MKRFLSALLCAVLLLGLLPGAASAAPEPLPGAAPEKVGIRNARMTMSHYDAYVGDKIEFEIFDVDAVGNVYYQWYVKRDTGSDYVIVYDENVFVQDHSRFVYYPVAPGAHLAEALIKDDESEEPYTSDDFIVRLRAAPKIASVESLGGTSLKISWNKVTGASGYEVWRSTSKTSGYKPVKSTTGTSFTNTYLKAGTRYFYKIRTYNLIGGVKVPSGSFSAVKAGVPLAKSAITKATGVSRTQVKLTWKKVTGATGYQIFKSTTPGGPYKPFKLPPTLTYTAAGMLLPKTYYFKVRPYKAFGTIKYYGPLSGYRSGRTK